MLLELWHDVRYRVRALVRRADVERDLHAELEAHLAREAEFYERQGVPAPEARRRARIAFGGLEDICEASRAARGTALVESMLQDARHALRGFRAKPGFTAVVCLTLALGIGANVAAFSVIKAVLLNPLPYPNAGRLVVISATASGSLGQRLSPTVPEYVAWRDRTHLFDGVATEGFLNADLASDETGAAAEQVATLRCTASLFRVLGMPPELGRTFTDAEDAIDTPADVVVISHRLWQRRYHGDLAVIGRHVRLDDATKTIIGVMSPDFVFAEESVDLWAPVGLNRSRLKGSARGWPVVARLKPGATVAAAQADADAVSARLGLERGETMRMGAVIRPLYDGLLGSYVRPLAILEGIAAVVLLLACANVAGLLLARAIARRGEFAIRAAIGAGRARLVRLLLIESLLLAGLSGGASLAVAWLALKVLVAQGPFSLPRADSIALDGHALLIALAVSTVAAVLFGLVPALYASRSNLAESLRSSYRAVWDPPRLLRLRGGLVAMQIALCVVLLVAAGLLINTFIRLRTNVLGGEPEGVVTFSVQFAPARFHKLIGSYSGLPLFDVSPAPARMTEDMWQQAEDLPGVLSAAAVNHVPFAGPGPSVPFTLEDQPVPSPRGREGRLEAQAQIVTPHFFATMRIPLLRGRDFGAVDTATAPWVVIINETMAKTFWPGTNPVGHHIRIDLVPDDQPREVIGIVADSRSSPSEREAVPVLYTPLDQQPSHYLAPYVGERLKMTLVARTTGDPLALAPALRTVAAAVDPGRPAVDVHPLVRDVSGQLAAGTYLTSTMTFFAVIATLLSVIGIYGVIAHDLAQRSRELGVRIVLGASQRDVWRLAFARIGWFLLCGLAVGVAAALASTRFIESALWGIGPTDAPTYLGAAGVMTLAALTAIWAPVRRVIAAAPAATLKAD